MNRSFDPIAYSYADAAMVSGYGIDAIKRAVAKGDLQTTAGTIDGRRIAKPVIPADALRRWLGITKEPAA